MIAFGSVDVKLIDIETCRCEVIMRELSNFKSLTFSPDGSKLVIIDSTPILYDVESKRVIKIITGKGKVCNRVKFSENGNIMFLISDESIMLLETETKKMISKYDIKCMERSFNSNLPFFATKSYDVNEIRIYNINDGSLFGQIEVQPNVHKFSFINHNSELLFHIEKLRIYFWDLFTREITMVINSQIPVFKILSIHDRLWLFSKEGLCEIWTFDGLNKICDIELENFGVGSLLIIYEIINVDNLLFLLTNLGIVSKWIIIYEEPIRVEKFRDINPREKCFNAKGFARPCIELQPEQNCAPILK